MTREISVTDKLEFFFKSFTLLIKLLLIRFFRPAYLPSCWATRILCFYRFLHRLFLNSAMPKRVVAINLLVAKSTEVGKSKATKVIFFLKKISCSFKNSRVFRLHKSILVIIKRSFDFNSSSINFWKIGRFLISLAPDPTSIRIFSGWISF